MRPIIVEPSKAHTASLIWLHGLGDTGAGWSEELRLLAPHLPHVRMIFPTAPTRPVTLNFGMSMPAWYDILGLTPRDKEDFDGLQASALSVKKMIDGEIEKGISPNRIVLGGFSQGGAVTLYTLFSLDYNLAGGVSFSGYLPLADGFKGRLKASTLNVPVLLCHGESDPVVPHKWGQLTYSKLNIEGASVSFKSYPGLQHGACAQEISDFLTFLHKVIP